MNTQIGKSFGIALLLAAGLLAVMLAWNPFTASAEVVENSATATATSITGGADTTLTIEFSISGTTEALGDTKVDITLPDGTTSKNTDSKLDPVNDVVATLGGAETGIKGVTGTLAKITLEATDNTLAKQQNIKVVISKLANPATIPDPFEVTIKQGSPDAETAPITFLPDPCPNSKVNSSCTAGAAVRLTLEAKVAAEEDDVITIDLSKFGLPPSIDTDDVTITGDNNVSGNPSDVSIIGSKIELVFTDLNGSEEEGVSLAIDKETKIKIQQGAGITNPTKAGKYLISVNSNGEGAIEDETNEAAVQRTITVSPDDGASGTETTVTGKGFTDGTATVYVEGADSAFANKKGDALGSASVSGGTFTLNTDDIDETSTINAIDSAGDTANVPGEFEVTRSISVSPTEISKAETLTITLNDWDILGEISSVTFGGVNDVLVPDDLDKDGKYNGPVLTGMDEDKYDDFVSYKSGDTLKVKVPSDVRTGTLKVEVMVDGKAEGSANITVDPLSLSVSPTSAVQRQQITIQGSGFKSRDDITNIEVGGKNVTVPSGTEASSAGNVVLTFTVPEAIATSGSKTVKVEAASGRVGEAKLTIPKAAITLDPATSRRGSTVNVTGSGFPANDLILVQYTDTTATDGFRTVGTGQTDSAGSFTGSFVVPSFAGIGASVDVKGASSVNDVGISATAKHSLPASVLTLNPTEVSSGENITIMGENLAVYASISKLEIGGVDVTPVPAPSTDSDGAFSAMVLVPQTELGNQQVKLTMGDNVITTFLKVVPAAAAPTDPAELFADLGARLLRVWEFDNDSQTWSFYDPRPDFEDFNSLTEVSSGDIATIIISSGAPIAFQGTNLYPGGTSVVVLK